MSVVGVCRRERKRKRRWGNQQWDLNTCWGCLASPVPSPRLRRNNRRRESPRIAWSHGTSIFTTSAKTIIYIHIIHSGYQKPTSWGRVESAVDPRWLIEKDSVSVRNRLKAFFEHFFECFTKNSIFIASSINYRDSFAFLKKLRFFVLHQ